MAERGQTERGTPHAETWDADWARVVEDAEERLCRRVCGARTMSGVPCPLESTHRSGRCRFHGGVSNIGAQPGNQNALRHGLYSRRLQRCGGHCAMWAHCPYAGDDVLALPKAERPACVYEREEYDALIAESETSCPDPPVRHHVALLQVLMGRAGHALSVQGLTQCTAVSSSNYNLVATKVSAALDAYLRLVGEYRRFLAMRGGVGPPRGGADGRASVVPTGLDYGMA